MRLSKTSRMYIHNTFFLLIIFTCIGAWSETKLSVILSGLFAPFLAWYSGSGSRGTIHGPSDQKIIGTILGITTILVSLIWVSYTGWWVSIFGIYIPGHIWVTIGFFIGFIFTTKEDSDAVLD
jgi:hypothetical protein